MPIIIDTNQISRVLDGDAPECVLLHTDLFSAKITMVYGGQLEREYQRQRSIIPLLLQLNQQGIAKRQNSTEIDRLAETLKDSCDSDDPHIIALATLAKSRLLCTEDAALRDDFRNKALLDKPRGRIYTATSHRYLVQNFGR